MKDYQLEIGSGPGDTWTLDFSAAWESCRWNKQILRRISDQIKLKSREERWNVPNVSDIYLQEGIYGHIKRARDAYSVVQPRFLASFQRLETPEEIAERIERATTERTGSVNSRARRARVGQENLGTTCD